ncbi:MAG: hypothetical protein J6D34_08540 [Atopobiaceae bacterium]|nr:hypothetical protein [Atopobiaceae bacterium]
MSYSEERWRAYVLAYDVEVAQEDMEEELYRIRADMKHRMVYAHMTGAETHPFPDMELEEQKDALVEAAIFEVKEPLVLKDLTKKLDVTVTPEELLAEGEAIARRQNSTLEEVKRFFGQDLAFLERDVRERKIREWACSR